MSNQLNGFDKFLWQSLKIWLLVKPFGQANYPAPCLATRQRKVQKTGGEGALLVIDWIFLFLFSFLYLENLEGHAHPPPSNVPASAAAMLIDDDVPSNGPVPAASNETMMYDTANCSMRQKSWYWCGRRMVGGFWESYVFFHSAVKDHKL